MDTYNGKIILNNNIQYPMANKPNAVKDENNSFKDILDGLNEENLKFSKHAMERINSRNINLSNEQVERVETGVNQAKEKGLNESLVLVDNVALIVSINNKTVITATDKENTIFTNIDGAIIV